MKDNMIKRRERVKFSSDKRKADSGSQQRSHIPQDKSDSLIKSVLKKIKIINPTTEGKCPYCHKKVQSLENHIHDKHKGEKPIKK